MLRFARFCVVSMSLVVVPCLVGCASGPATADERPEASATPQPAAGEAGGDATQPVAGEAATGEAMRSTEAAPNDGAAEATALEDAAPAMSDNAAVAGASADEAGNEADAGANAVSAEASPGDGTASSDEAVMDSDAGAAPDGSVADAGAADGATDATQGSAADGVEGEAPTGGAVLEAQAPNDESPEQVTLETPATTSVVQADSAAPAGAGVPLDGLDRSHWPRMVVRPESGRVEHNPTYYDKPDLGDHGWYENHPMNQHTMAMALVRAFDDSEDTALTWREQPARLVRPALFYFRTLLLPFAMLDEAPDAVHESPELPASPGK